MVNIDQTEGFELSPLEQNALERRKRLEDLRKRTLEKRRNGNADDEEGPLMLLNPRSYKTVTSNIINVGDEVRDVLQKTEQDIQTIIDDAKNIQLGDDLDISVLAPKKVDWDLKRGIQEDLDKLERRTNRAIVQIVRQRLQREKDLDLAKTVDMIQEKDTASLRH
uniref:PRP18 homolog n=2 Tax=Bursaphelenchus xylophilus TaxID=6326 RepID=A0A1I7SQK9_BURXY